MKRYSNVYEVKMECHVKKKKDCSPPSQFLSYFSMVRVFVHTILMRAITRLPYGIP